MVGVTNEISVDELRIRLADVLNEAARTGARTVITRAGKRIAAVVPVDEADMLEEAEDACLLKLAYQARAAQGERPYKALADVLAEYAEESGEESR